MFAKVKINNELLGILYMLLCQFSFATNDAFVKNIYEHFDEIFVLKSNNFYKRDFYTTIYCIISLHKKTIKF